MIILMIITGILAGCASLFQDIDDMMSRKRFQSDYLAFETALSVYDAGDYKKALSQFKALKAISDSETITRRAWLGEICCRLMQAETQADYTIAIGMWHDFGDSAPDDNSIQDLDLLDPLILRLMTSPPPPQVLESHLPAKAAPEGTAKLADQQSEGRQQVNRQLQAELIELKQKAKRADQLQQQMDQIVAENRALKEKIKALEAIDQKIQKKKTKISAPSE